MFVCICAHCTEFHSLFCTFLCLLIAWVSVSTDNSSTHSWILKQWHHCASYHTPWSSDACLCVFLFCVCADVFVRRSIKKYHCVTRARLVPSCFRGEGKTGRIRGGMSMHSSRRRSSRALLRTTYINRRKCQQAIHGALLSCACERLKISRYWEKKTHFVCSRHGVFVVH